MPFVAVLDASVLYPLPLRDTLLRVAEAELYDPRWSPRILDEVARNLIADGRATDEQARRLADAMAEAFDGAAIPQPTIDRLEPAMTNHPKDRHVLATAVASDADAIVTLDLSDYPPDACEPFAIEALHPDDFLKHLYARNPQVVDDAVRRQAAALTRPQITVSDVLDRLATTAPAFANALRERT